jgi:hypothetical protein
MSERRGGTKKKHPSCARWRTSSYSGTNSNYVEVAVAWRISSHSGANGNCMEVAVGPKARVLVRDAKDREGPVLAFWPVAWRRFAEQVKVGPLTA